MGTTLPANPLLAHVTVRGAFDVAEYLNRTIPTACPLPNVPEWEEVRDALYAISNDTDAIVTRDDNSPALPASHPAHYPTPPAAAVRALLAAADERIDSSPDALPFDSKVGKVVVAWLRGRANISASAASPAAPPAAPDVHDVAVIDAASLDAPHPLPWLVQWADGTILYTPDEEAACNVQRQWRAAIGLDPMTGEPAQKKRLGIVVARHEHKHGESVCVFYDADDAEDWRQSIADQYWDERLMGGKPSDPVARADAYFEHGNRLGDEFFSTETVEVEGSPPAR